MVTDIHFVLLPTANTDSRYDYRSTLMSVNWNTAFFRVASCNSIELVQHIIREHNSNPSAIWLDEPVLLLQPDVARIWKNAVQSYAMSLLCNSHPCCYYCQHNPVSCHDTLGSTHTQTQLCYMYTSPTHDKQEYRVNINTLIHRYLLFHLYYRHVGKHIYCWSSSSKVIWINRKVLSDVSDSDIHGA